MDPDIREYSNIFESNDKSPLNRIKTLLDAVKDIYNSNSTTFKWLLSLMKDSFKKPLEYKVELIIKSQYNEIMEYIKNKN